MSGTRTLSYCAAEVRRFDPDRYLCALFAPPGRREDVFALYAFNVEIARTRESVSEPMLGMVRLQWWRDAIAAIYGGTPPRHEVLGASAAAVAEAAAGHLRAARERRREVPRAALAAMLPACLAEGDLKRLGRMGYNVFDPRLASAGVGRKLRVVAHAALGRY